MGNGATKVKNCFFSGCVAVGCARESSPVASEPSDEGLGHSFFYIRPEPPILRRSPSKVHHSEETTTFRSISGAAVSANTATPLSTAINAGAGAAFESSTSFASIPLQISAPLTDRGFFSGPIDRDAFTPLRRSFSHGLAVHRRSTASLLRSVSNVISRSISLPIRKSGTSESSSSIQLSVPSEASECCHWAQGRVGEDRVHVVISEEQGWLFVGIYDGFNGPDATDYLLSNLYSAVQREIKGLIWDEDKDSFISSPEVQTCDSLTSETTRRSKGLKRNREDNQRRWKYEWVRERLELDRIMSDQLSRQSSRGTEAHSKVLKALSLALKKTEEEFLGIADMIASENPELALMGSCVLVMVMKGEDVYLMNVGDSRAVLGKKTESNSWESVRNERQNLESINEETLHDLQSYDQMDDSQNLMSLQLTKDHSTCMEEEVKRIRNEHPEDALAIVNDRVKGSLKVTRAFGAGFLKQPRWNNALLKMFRIEYIGSSPYITCRPFLFHHRLSSKDKFLILSSDGLYQYFTNEEAVAEIQSFISANPDGDPAQHLVEQVLFRAAKNAGMNFHELIEIPQGDRRRYHDDISIIIISFEGRLWRSCM